MHNSVFETFKDQLTHTEYSNINYNSSKMDTDQIFQEYSETRGNDKIVILDQ